MDQVEIVVCNTCRFKSDARADDDGRRGGELMLAALQAEANAAGAKISLGSMSCLFACSHHCVVHLRAPGKIAYVLGRFEPGETAARAILSYAREYAQSPDGVVPFLDWPDDVKGHFIVRLPAPSEPSAGEAASLWPGER